VTHFTAEQAKARNVEAMGDELGVQYSALWQEVALLYRNWQQYVELFGIKPSRLDLMNSTAPYFFWMLQEDLWDVNLLHIARLTDKPATGKNKNLTIQNFLDLIQDEKIEAEIKKLVDVALEKTEFARDWRNRHIAHNDLDLSLERSATPLADASRLQVKEALKVIADVMNAVDFHYLHSETRYDLGGPIDGALPLLYALDRSIKLQDERRERLENGAFRDEDFDPADL
jgi:hypothetical protein